MGEAEDRLGNEEEEGKEEERQSRAGGRALGQELQGRRWPSPQRRPRSGEGRAGGNGREEETQQGSFLRLKGFLIHCFLPSLPRLNQSRPTFLTLLVTGGQG